MSRANVQLRPLQTKDVNEPAIADINVLLLRVNYANNSSESDLKVCTKDCGIGEDFQCALAAIAALSKTPSSVKIGASVLIL